MDNDSRLIMEAYRRVILENRIPDDIAKAREEFEKDQRDLNNIGPFSPTGNKSHEFGKAYDRSFHLTKKVAHFLNDISDPPMLFQRRMENAEKNGNHEAIERYKYIHNKSISFMKYVWGEIANLVASLPPLAARDERTDRNIDPWIVLKKHFPNGENIGVNKAFESLYNSLKAYNSDGGKMSATRDLYNMAEIVRDFAPIDQGLMHKLSKYAWGKDEEEMQQAESEAMKDLLNPEFNDVEQHGDSFISKKIQPEDDAVN